MKKMRISIKAVPLLLLALVMAIVPLAGAACSDSDKVTTIVMQTPYSESDITGAMANKFKELVEDYTDGKVEVQLTFQGGIVEHKDQFEALRTGILDAAIQNAGYCRGVNPNFDFSGQLQGLILTQAHGEAVYSNATYRDFISQLFEDYDIHFVDYISSYLMFGYFANFNIDSLYDVAGKKLYLGRQGSLDPANKMLGAAEQIYVPFADFTTAVGNKQIDIQLTPVTIAAQYGSLSVFSNVLLRPFYNTNLVLISSDKWNSLSTEIQDIINDEVMPEVLTYTNNIAIQQHETAVMGIKDALGIDNVKVVTPAEEEQIWGELQDYPDFTSLAASMNQTIYTLIKSLRPEYTDYDQNIKTILDYAGIAYS